MRRVFLYLSMLSSPFVSVAQAQYLDLGKYHQPPASSVRQGTLECMDAYQTASIKVVQSGQILLGHLQVHHEGLFQDLSGQPFKGQTLFWQQVENPLGGMQYADPFVCAKQNTAVSSDHDGDIWMLCAPTAFFGAHNIDYTQAQPADVLNDLAADAEAEYRDSNPMMVGYVTIFTTPAFGFAEKPVVHFAGKSFRLPHCTEEHNRTRDEAGFGFYP